MALTNISPHHSECPPDISLNVGLNVVLPVSDHMDHITAASGRASVVQAEHQTVSQTTMQITCGEGIGSEIPLRQPFKAVPVFRRNWHS